MSFYTDYPKYPTSIFNDTDYPDQVDNTDIVYSKLINALKEEMQAGFAELGTLPKGAYASVKARLEAQSKKIQDADGDTSLNTEETSDKDEIQGKVAGVEFFRGHSNGIVDFPKQSRCRAKRSADQTMTTNSFTKIQFNAESYDTQNEYDSSTNYRFTAKKGGYYLISAVACVLTPDNGSRNMILIYKNGVSVQGTEGEQIPGASQYPRPNTIDILQLTTNDYVEIFFYHNSATDKNINPASRVAISKVN